MCRNAIGFQMIIVRGPFLTLRLPSVVQWLGRLFFVSDVTGSFLPEIGDGFYAINRMHRVVHTMLAARTQELVLW